MGSRRFGSLAASGLALALLFLAGPAQGHPAGRPSGCLAADSSRPSCCFTNPQYSGVCAVEPGEDETCSSILAYLNNPRSQGKTYCGSTSIRGGWKQVTCATPGTR